MQHPVLFIDDGGVMNSGVTRGPQWHRLVGEFFAPSFGGAPKAWGEANRVVATALFDEYARTMFGKVDADFRAWLRSYRLRWTRGMCERVGVPAPPDEECIELTQRAAAYVTPRVHSALPGAVDTLRLFHERGFTLYTASGEASDELHGYLTGMGVCDCFVRLYGPDLINTPKEGPAYYTRIFLDAGVDAANAIVIDDTPLALGWAATAGARTAWVRSNRGDGSDATVSLTSLADLPSALDRLLGVRTTETRCGEYP